MATLSGNKIKNTYQALVKFSDNGNITTSAKQLTDGFGNNSPMWVSTTQVGIGVTPEAGLNLHVYGDAKIGSNLTVIGNLVVEGSTTTVGTDTLTVKDPLIVLANNNTSTDAVDIGFYGKYTPSGTTLYSGLFREALTGKYRLFKGLQIEPTTTVSISGTGYDKADLVIGNIETNGVVEDSSLFTFSKDVIINKAGTTKLTIDNVTQNKSIELECTSLNNVLNAEGDMIFSSGSPIFKYTSSSFQVLSVDSTFGGDIIANGDITLSNSSKIKWNGTSALEIYDDGTNAIKIETGSSRILDVCSDIFQLKAGDTNNNDLMLTHGSEGVSIYYRGNTNPGVKFATTSDGVDVTGELAVSGTGQSSFGGQVTIPLTPTSSTDAASKGYVDTQIGANNELSEVLANGNITDGTDIVVSAGDDITFTDTSKILLGDDDDLQIYHNGTNAVIDNGTNNLLIQTASQTIISSDATNNQLTLSHSTGNWFAKATNSNTLIIGSESNATDNITLDTTNGGSATFAGNVLLSGYLSATSTNIGTGATRWIGSDGTTSTWFYNVPTGGNHYFAVNNTNQLSINENNAFFTRNLGIGVTPSTSYVDSRAIEIGANGYIWSEQTASIYGSFMTGIGFYLNAAGATIYKTTNLQISRHVQYQGEHLFQYAAAGTAGGAITWSEAFRTSDTGNVGIGCSPVAPLQIERASNTTLALSNSGSVTSGTRGEIAVYNSNISTCAAIKAVADTDNVGTGLEFYTRPVGGSLTNSMTIDSSGNVGIGGSPNPFGWGNKHLTLTTTGINQYVALDIIGTGNAAGAILFGGGDGSGSGTNIGRAQISAHDGSDLVFSTNGSNSGASFNERMRIDSVGTIDIKGQNNNVNGMAAIIARLGSNCNNTTSYAFIAETGNANKCFIHGNGNIVNSNNSYGQLSDKRLKENIKDATPKLDDLMKVKVKNFNMIGDDSKQIGVIAQELEEIFPSMISENKGSNPDDETLYKGVKYSVFVPILVKAIQELKAEIDDLKNKCNCK